VTPPAVSEPFAHATAQLPGPPQGTPRTRIHRHAHAYTGTHPCDCATACQGSRAGRALGCRPACAADPCSTCVGRGKRTHEHSIAPRGEGPQSHNGRTARAGLPLAPPADQPTRRRRCSSAQTRPAGQPRWGIEGDKRAVMSEKGTIRGIRGTKSGGRHLRGYGPSREMPPHPTWKCRPQENPARPCSAAPEARQVRPRRAAPPSRAAPKAECWPGCPPERRKER
jgi:hypothetical protein